MRLIMSIKFFCDVQFDLECRGSDVTFSIRIKVLFWVALSLVESQSYTLKEKSKWSFVQEKSSVLTNNSEKRDQRSIFNSVEHIYFVRSSTEDKRSSVAFDHVTHRIMQINTLRNALVSYYISARPHQLVIVSETEIARRMLNRRVLTTM